MFTFFSAASHFPQGKEAPVCDTIKIVSKKKSLLLVTNDEIKKLTFIGFEVNFMGKNSTKKKNEKEFSIRDGVMFEKIFTTGKFKQSSKTDFF